MVDFTNKLVFFYSARAVQSSSNACPNLHNNSAYDSQVFVKSHSVQDIKDVINCIGGVQILFPLLESPAPQVGSAKQFKPFSFWYAAKVISFPELHELNKENLNYTVVKPVCSQGLGSERDTNADDDIDKSYQTLKSLDASINTSQDEWEVSSDTQYPLD